MRLTRISVIALVSIFLASILACQSESHSAPIPAPVPAIRDASILYHTMDRDYSHPEEIYGAYYVSGTIQNVGNIKLSGCTITVEWHDCEYPSSQKADVHIDSITLYNIYSGDVRDFRIDYTGGRHNHLPICYGQFFYYKIWVSSVW